MTDVNDENKLHPIQPGAFLIHLEAFRVFYFAKTMTALSRMKGAENEKD